MKLGDYFHGKPVILVLAYYRCPMLCTLVLNGLTQGLLDMDFDIGRDFEVVTVSFDPRETPQMAAAKKQTYLTRDHRPGAADGWHFLTGKQAEIKRLADAIGFRYAYDPRTDQFAHASGLTILTPQGKISRYFYDVQFPGRDLHSAWSKPAPGRSARRSIGILLFCFHYDASAGKYGPAIFNFLRSGGVLTVVGLRRLGWLFAFARAATAVPDTAGGCAAMKEIALFPQQASTSAIDVDLLFLFLTVVCGSVGFLSRGAVDLGSRSAIDAGPATRELRPDAAIARPGMVLDLGHGPDLRLHVRGRGESLYRCLPCPAKRLGRLHHRQAMDVEVPTSPRAAQINTLHVPVGRPVKLLLTSEDVIHSFFVPAFRLHMDVLPTRFTSAWFEASAGGGVFTCFARSIVVLRAFQDDRPGDRDGSRAGYQDWLSATAEGSLALEGRKMFLKYRCVSCHSADENARAPVLEAIYGRAVALRDGTTALADENYLRESILHPAAQVVAGYQPIMPTFEGIVSRQGARWRWSTSSNRCERAKPPARRVVSAAGADQKDTGAAPVPAGAEPGARKRAAMSVDQLESRLIEVSTPLPMRELSQCFAGYPLLAVDHRPQADRVALSDFDHRDVLYRGIRHRRGPVEPADSRRQLADGRHVQSSVHAARRGDGLLFSGAGGAVGAGQFCVAADDRRQGRGPAAIEPVQLVSVLRRAPPGRCSR